MKKIPVLKGQTTIDKAIEKGKMTDIEIREEAVYITKGFADNTLPLKEVSERMAKLMKEGLSNVETVETIGEIEILIALGKFLVKNAEEIKRLKDKTS